MKTTISDDASNTQPADISWKFEATTTDSSTQIPSIEVSVLTLLML